MKARGFKFVGSTIVYAHMQATGMVNDHLVDCFRYKEIEENLRISAGTLRTYVASVYKKLHVHSRTEAVVKFLQK